VAIAGDGADELFGSYLSHRLALPLANYAEYVRSGDASLIRPFETQPDFLARAWPRWRTGTGATS
jgi:Asparagine synthase.